MHLYWFSHINIDQWPFHIFLFIIQGCLSVILSGRSSGEPQRHMWSFLARCPKRSYTLDLPTIEKWIYFTGDQQVGHRSSPPCPAASIPQVCHPLSTVNHCHLPKLNLSQSVFFTTNVIVNKDHHHKQHIHQSPALGVHRHLQQVQK